MRLPLVAQAAINAMAFQLYSAIFTPVYVAKRSTVIAVPVLDPDIGHRKVTDRAQPAITPVVVVVVLPLFLLGIFRDLRTVILYIDKPLASLPDKSRFS